MLQLVDSDIINIKRLWKGCICGWIPRECAPQSKIHQQIERLIERRPIC